MKTVWLSISSWRGICVGAVHWYGELVDTYGDDGKRIRLERKLTAAEALALNEKYSIKRDSCLRYRKGSKTYGFDAREDVIEAAKKCWRKQFPAARRLALGNPTYCKGPTLDRRGTGEGQGK